MLICKFSILVLLGLATLGVAVAITTTGGGQGQTPTKMREIVKIVRRFRVRTTTTPSPEHGSPPPADPFRAKPYEFTHELTPKSPESGYHTFPAPDWSLKQKLYPQAPQNQVNSNYNPPTQAPLKAPSLGSYLDPAYLMKLIRQQLSPDAKYTITSSMISQPNSQPAKEATSSRIPPVQVTPTAPSSNHSYSPLMKHPPPPGYSHTPPPGFLPFPTQSYPYAGIDSGIEEVREYHTGEIPHSYFESIAEDSAKYSSKPGPPVASHGTYSYSSPSNEPSRPQNSYFNFNSINPGGSASGSPFPFGKESSYFNEPDKSGWKLGPLPAFYKVVDTSPTEVMAPVPAPAPTPVKPSMYTSTSTFTASAPVSNGSYSTLGKIMTAPGMTPPALNQYPSTPYDSGSSSSTDLGSEVYQAPTSAFESSTTSTFASNPSSSNSKYSTLGKVMTAPDSTPAIQNQYDPSPSPEIQAQHNSDSASSPSLSSSESVNFAPDKYETSFIRGTSNGMEDYLDNVRPIPMPHNSTNTKVFYNYNQMRGPIMNQEEFSDGSVPYHAFEDYGSASFKKPEGQAYVHGKSQMESQSESEYGSMTWLSSGFLPPKHGNMYLPPSTSTSMYSSYEPPKMSLNGEYLPPIKTSSNFGEYLPPKHSSNFGEYLPPKHSSNFGEYLPPKHNSNLGEYLPPGKPSYVEYLPPSRPSNYVAYMPTSKFVNSGSYLPPPKDNDFTKYLPPSKEPDYIDYLPPTKSNDFVHYFPPKQSSTYGQYLSPSSPTKEPDYIEYLPPTKVSEFVQYMPPIKGSDYGEYLPHKQSGNVGQYLPPPKSSDYGQYLPPKESNPTSEYLPPNHVQTYNGSVSAPATASATGMDEQPEISKTIYVSIPLPPAPTQQAQASVPTPSKLPPQRHYKIVFIQAPTEPPIEQTTAAPLPDIQTKTLIYVMQKSRDPVPAVKIPTPPSTKPTPPEVYFIKYSQGNITESSSVGAGTGTGYGYDSILSSSVAITKEIRPSDVSYSSSVSKVKKAISNKN